MRTALPQLSRLSRANGVFAGVDACFSLYAAVRLSCSHSTVPARAARIAVPAGRPKSKAKAWLPLCEVASLLPCGTR
jgi:hypothetical protein